MHFTKLYHLQKLFSLSTSLARSPLWFMCGAVHVYTWTYVWRTEFDAEHLYFFPPPIWSRVSYGNWSSSIWLYWLKSEDSFCLFLVNTGTYMDDFLNDFLELSFVFYCLWSKHFALGHLPGTPAAEFLFLFFFLLFKFAQVIVLCVCCFC